MADKTLADVLSKETLRNLATGESFSRGRRYFEQGRVKALKESEGVITARVRGTDWYDVELHGTAGELHGACSCPVGSDGLFCKHCVATGIAWIVDNALAADERKGASSPEAMQEYLAGLPRQKLVDMLMAQARRDSGLRQRLALAVAKSRPAGPDLESIEAAIRDATRAGEPWSRRHEADRVRGLEAVIEALNEILVAGDAATVVRLAAFGLERSAEEAGQGFDPSNEMLTIASQFASLHRRACAAARPDPGQLAQWLFEFETTFLSRAFEDLVFQYVDLLGEEGVAVYRKLAEAAWREEKARQGRVSPGKRARLDSILSNAALLVADPALMAEASQFGMGHPWSYWYAANKCLEIRQQDKALVWAELGVKTFPDRPYEALRRLLADEYTRRGRLTDALNQTWALFTEEPSLDSYARLRALAKKAGQPAVWRNEALEYLKERAARAPKAEPGGERLHYGSLIVEILLKEKDAETAWREAQGGQCHFEVWLKLAKTRESGHPADAIRVYQRLAEEVVQEADDAAYRASVRCLRRAADVVAELGQTQKFREYLAGFRERNKRKKNLLWLVDAEFGAGDG